MVIHTPTDSLIAVGLNYFYKTSDWDKREGFLVTSSTSVTGPWNYVADPVLYSLVVICIEYAAANSNFIAFQIWRQRRHYG